MAITIHGKNYIEVKDRLAEFRASYKDYSIITEIINYDSSSGTIIIKASVINENGRVLSTGHAHEWQDDKTSLVNKTSYVENCETSAIGRALACLGIGIDEAYASANEVVLAKGQMESKQSIEPEGSWASAIIPIGKNKGKALGDLSPKSRQWYIEEYQANEQFANSIAFRKALDQCKEEMFLGEGDLNPVVEEAEKSDDSEEVDEESVPF